MKKFLPYIFILLSNLCFGSFPVQNNLYNDTIIERKKERHEKNINNVLKNNYMDMMMIYIKSQ